MDRLEDVAASGMTVTIKGKKYELSPLSMGDMADFPQYVKSRRLEVAQNIEDPNERLELQSRIMESTVNADKEMVTFDGSRFMLWKALSKKQPKLTIEDVDQLIDMDNINEIVAILLELGGKPKNPMAKEVKQKK